VALIPPEAACSILSHPASSSAGMHDDLALAVAVVMWRLQEVAADLGDQ
jgi:hypothetical protein